MSRKERTETYYVEGRLALNIGLEISAKSLDEAVEKSKALKIADFVEILGDHNDSNFAITGVFKGVGLPEV